MTNGKKYNTICIEDMPLYEAFNIEQEILNNLTKYRYKVKDLVEFKSGWTECFPMSILPKLIREFNNKVKRNG